MEVLLALVAIAVITFAFLMLKKQPKKVNKPLRGRVSQAAASKTQNSFQATAIVPGENACQAARRLQGTSFLVREVNTPNLPLAECTQMSDCQCRYDHQDDRRSDDNDRRGFHTLREALYLNSEEIDQRAQKRGRRAPD